VNNASQSAMQAAIMEASTPATNPLFVAVCAVMAEVHGLKKDEKNPHGNYNFVSVDSFKTLVRPLMAKHGLGLAMTEESFDLIPLPNSKGGETMNARIKYAFQLRHVSGEVEPLEYATIVLPYTGAQTAGAAKSYVLKEYLKGRFMVATGDKDVIVGGADADSYAPQEYGTDGAPPAKSAYQARKDGTDKIYEAIDAGLNKIEREGNMEDLAAYWTANRAKVADMPTKWKDHLTAKKDALKAQFEQAASRPLNATVGGDHDPNTGEVIETGEILR
jgi:hypothetical protein